VAVDSYSYNVDENGVTRKFHANHLRSYYVRVESAVCDACVFVLPERNYELISEVCDSYAVLYDDDRQKAKRHAKRHILG